MKKAVFSADAGKLADHIGIGLASPPWDGIAAIDTERVQRYADTSNTLPPDECLMGHDLVSQEDHERRIAYFLCHKAVDPLTGKTSVAPDNDTLLLTDGHHRLFAAMMTNSRVSVHLISGSRSSAEKALAHIHGVWLQSPDMELIGDQLFFAYPSGKRITLEVTQSHDGRVWINTSDTGECLARYNRLLWNVVPHDQLHSDHLLAKREDGVEESTFFERFIQTFIQEYSVDDARNLLSLTPPSRKCYA